MKTDLNKFAFAVAVGVTSIVAVKVVVDPILKKYFPNLGASNV
tara:strand:+ start:819 stop:947 length:129 start_codon:yes stop_codon:yes gene_type:complete